MASTQGNRRWAALAVVAILMMLAAMAASAQNGVTFRTLHSFDLTGGGEPVGALVQAANGKLYGTASIGGANGGGAVFEVTQDGTVTTLYSFCSQTDCADGATPQGALVQAIDGDFYGTTYSGGELYPCNIQGGCGTVFKITPSGVLTTLHSFDLTDGGNPYAGLVQGPNSHFYGTTYSGGASGLGTVFEIIPDGTLTTLHSFKGTDGYNPYAALVQGSNGSFYGTTGYGGADGGGTVFEITQTGSLTTLYNFCSQDGCADGEDPVAGLVQGSDGNFYGTTFGGGTNVFGSVFKMTPGGRLTTLYKCSQTPCPRGENFNAGLVQGTDGNLYGMATYGGIGDDGTIFRIDLTSGLLTPLYSFCSLGDCLDGAAPVVPLVQDTNGNFYGTAWEGGAANVGTVFVLGIGLGPFVGAVPTLGKVGTTVRILGDKLTGATSVTFNGTPAVFKVVSGFEITTTVPVGASSGTVEVTTPRGTLSSNVPFRVAP